jgi:hypothetical protein
MRFNFLRGVENDHFDISRILWLASAVAGIGYTGAHLVINHAFNIMEFGAGMGVLLAGGGGATAMKDTAVAKAKAQGEVTQ